MILRSTKEEVEEVKQEREKSQKGVSSWAGHCYGHLGLRSPEVLLRNHLGVISLWLEGVGSLSIDLHPALLFAPCLHLSLCKEEKARQRRSIPTSLPQVMVGCGEPLFWWDLQPCCSPVLGGRLLLLLALRAQPSDSGRLRQHSPPGYEPFQG